MKFETFFSRRAFVVTITSTCLLYVLGGVAFHELSEYLAERRKEQGIAQQKSAFDKLSKEEKSIRKTEEYLTGSITLADTTERVFLSYLQRKFDLHPMLGAGGPPISVNRDPRTYPEHVNYLVRIAYPDEIVREKPRKSELETNTQITNIYSANCDHMELPANFWTVMGESVRLGSYFASHVALALEMMESNNCAVPPIADDIDHDAAMEMVKIINDLNTIADLRYEAVAFLLMRDHRDLVEQKWIDQIISEQHEDGTWSKGGGDGEANFHSTLLAFWSLLEYSHSNTPYEPLILRPTK